MLQVKIINPDPDVVHVSEMKLGDVAVVVKVSDETYLGHVIYRVYGDRFVSLADASLTWGLDSISKDDFFVKILPAGTTLELTVVDKERQA